MFTATIFLPRVYPNAVQLDKLWSLKTVKYPVNGTVLLQMAVYGLPLFMTNLVGMSTKIS